jgi:hypothetical protein
MLWVVSKNALNLRGLVFDVIFKIVTFFLVGMGVLAMFGKFTFPGQKQLQNAKCKKCGRFKIGRGPCACGKGRG